MRRPPPLWSIALGLILLGGAVVGFVPHGVASFGGPFALTDQHGATVTDASLRVPRASCSSASRAAKRSAL